MPIINESETKEFNFYESNIDAVDKIDVEKVMDKRPARTFINKCLVKFLPFK